MSAVVCCSSTRNVKAGPMIESESTSSVFDFDPLAVEYDAWYETAEGRLYDTLEKRALRHLIGKVENGERLLEMGMGTGWWSLFFSQLGFCVTGVDVATRMVHAARSKNIPHARFGIADAHQLPFVDDSFDAAAAITSLEFTRDPRQAIRELVRCVKPAGSIFLGVLNSEAPLNRTRKDQVEGPFAPAHLFSNTELRDLIAPLGRITIKPCAFPLSSRLLPAIAAIVDDVQAAAGRTTGAFFAARVDR